MITEDERFIEIQAILAFSDVLPENCTKINDLIIELSKENEVLKKQQKEFIKYMMNTIKELSNNETDDEDLKGYIYQRENTFKEILSKYNQI